MWGRDGCRRIAAVETVDQMSKYVSRVGWVLKDHLEIKFKKKLSSQTIYIYILCVNVHFFICMKIEGVGSGIPNIF